MDENELSRIVVDAAYRIHVRLGPGLLESVYERVLEYELTKTGLQVARQVKIPLVYDTIEFEEGFRADLIVNDKVVVEVKSIERLAPVHKKVLLTYLRLTGKHLGLLINFSTERIKDGIARVVDNLPE